MGLIDVKTGDALKGIGEGIGGIGSAIGNLLISVRTAITGKAPLDPTKLAEIEATLLQIESQAMNAQTELNKIEAASPSKFKSWWRPAGGWLCVTGLAWATFISPIWTWVSAIWLLPAPPAVDTGILISLLIAMLGLGSYRTYEKTRNGNGNGKK